MLAIAGIWSVIEVTSIGGIVENTLDKKFESLTAFKNMKQALEREDSGILLSLLGKTDEGDNIILSADSLFEKSFIGAKKSVTDNEEKIIIDIREKYSQYIRMISDKKVFSDNETRLDWYFTNPHEQFINLTQIIDKFIAENDRMIFNTSKMITDKSRRAIMPGVIAVIAAIVCAVLFHSLISFYFVNPLIEITKRIRKFTSQRIPYNYSVESQDELSELNDAVDILCSHVLAEESKR